MFYLTLNCWFCNSNSRVSIFSRNSWTCFKCDQYNGFNKDGDYNKEISEMYANPAASSKPAQTKAKNCLCSHCNYCQQLKIEKLSQFKPKNEETYDLEVKLYKEELEKMFELCHRCKSKVKFEITKQDGILKQYLLRYGKLNYFFEFNNKKPAKATPLPKPAKKASRLDKPNSFVRLVSYMAVLALATLTLVYNEKPAESTAARNETESAPCVVDEYLSEFERLAAEHVDTRLAGWIEAARELLFNSTTRLGRPFESKQAQLDFFNGYIATYPLVIYFICCFLIVTWPRSAERKCQASLLLVCFVWIVDLVLIIANFRQYLVFLAGSAAGVGLRHVATLVPCIQLAVAAQLCLWLVSSAEKPRCQPPAAEFTRKYEFTETPSSLQASSVAKMSAPLVPFNNSHVQFNYASISPDSYSLMKFLQSTTSAVRQPQRRAATASTFAYCKSVNYENSLIRPARFVPEVSECASYKFRSESNRRNSLDISDRMSNATESDDSDESSIVSGLTNLYLTRNRHHYHSSESLDTLELQPKLSRTSTFAFNKTQASQADDQYSFYQTEANRSILTTAANSAQKPNRPNKLNVFVEQGKRIPRVFEVFQ